MNENRRFETRGTAALACRVEGEGHANVIDYDIARRSYEARVRLAARQERRNLEVSQHSHRADSRSERNALRMQDVVESTYTPHMGMAESVGNALRNACHAIAAHPFVEQFRHGSLSGEELHGITYRQAIHSATACLALSMVMIFVGA